MSKLKVQKGLIPSHHGVYTSHRQSTVPDQPSEVLSDLRDQSRELDLVIVYLESLGHLPFSNFSILKAQDQHQGG